MRIGAFKGALTFLAEEEGFEPSLRGLRVKRFSRPPHSTTLPPLRMGCGHGIPGRVYIQFEKGHVAVAWNILAERWGFEPQIRFWRIHDFQSCSFGQLGHLSTVEMRSVSRFSLRFTGNANTYYKRATPRIQGLFENLCSKSFGCGCEHSRSSDFAFPSEIQLQEALARKPMLAARGKQGHNTRGGLNFSHFCRRACKP